MRIKLKDLKETIGNMPDDTEVEFVIFKLHLKEKGLLPLIVTIDKEQIKLNAQIKSLESQRKTKE